MIAPGRHSAKDVLTWLTLSLRCSPLIFLAMGAGIGNVTAAPDMPLTFYGEVGWGDRVLTAADTGFVVSAWIDGRETVSYQMGDKATDWYVLVLPMSSDDLPGIGHLGKKIEFRVNDYPIPGADHTIAEVPGSDINKPLQVQLVRLVIDRTPDGEEEIRDIPVGIRVTETAPLVLRGSTGVQWTCAGWTLTDGTRGTIKEGSGTDASFDLHDDGLLSWSWSQQFLLEATGSITGAVSFSFSSGQNGDYVSPGTTVTVQATPEEGFIFRHWEQDGAAPGQEERLSVVVDEPKRLVAVLSRDSDLDTLPDEWEFEKFGSPLRAHTSAEDDFDGDGVDNAVEHFVDSDPTDASSAVGFDSIESIPGGLRLRWRGSQTRAFRVMRSEDAGKIWTDISGTLGGAETMEFIDTAPVNPAHLYRLEVE